MEQFEQLLTCAICLDRYRNPKLLPCQHSFCMEPCMDGLVDYVRRQVKCPECRAEHRIPYQGVQAFPTNVTLQRFLELHIEITGELPDPTSGQIMERCSVCSEKSYCAVCAHCEKKCCPECKEEHIKILRKNICSINSQVRRALHRLQETLAQVEKNTLLLQNNASSVSEEVDEIYRRLNKALKDRTEVLRSEIERYSSTELKALVHLKENLEQEIANIQSNCDLADQHINENVPWDDNELLDTKELFLRTLEFIRNFEYEAGDYTRRMRFVMTHEPNQLVLHVAGYGELNIKPEGSALLGSPSSLAVPGGSPGLMRSKSDHRLASQYRQQDDDRSHGRNRYVPDYEYENQEYEAPRSRSRYRSRFMRNRDGDDSDGGDGNRSQAVRFHAPAGHERERVLDTEDASRGPLSGIFRLTDSPRVIKKLNECERAGKRKKDEPAQPKPQIQPALQRKSSQSTAVARTTSDDDEITRIKRQNKSSPGAQQPASPASAATASPARDSYEERRSVQRTSPAVHAQSEQPDESASRKTLGTPSRRASSEVTHAASGRGASSESTTSSESSGSSGRRSTGAPFSAEEMKQKFLSRSPQNSSASTTATSATAASRVSPVAATRPFQSRFLGNRAAPPPPTTTSSLSGRSATEEPPSSATTNGGPSANSQREPTPAQSTKPKSEEDDDEDSSSSSEESDSESEEESEPETTRSTPAAASAYSSSAMARTDIGPLLARSAEARRGSKEESPSTRFSSPRGISPAQSTVTPSSTTSTSSTPGYTSRFLNKSRSQAALANPSASSGLDGSRASAVREREPPDSLELTSGQQESSTSPRSRYAALKERRQRLARSRSSHNFGGEELDFGEDDPPSPTTQSPNAYLAAKYGAGSELARSRSTHALKSREPSPDRERPGAEKDGAALSSWARYLKNKYGNRTAKDKEPPSSSTSSVPSSRHYRY